MTDHQIKQRIAYLIEHGGIAEDPIEDLRTKIRILSYMTGLACAMGFVGVVELILLLK